MDQRDIVLTGLAPAEGASHSPVQVQKLFFLIDRELEKDIPGAPFFKFTPYHYGPFDSDVYSSLEQLAADGLVAIGSEAKWKTYRLTLAGQERGVALLGGLGEKARSFITRASAWIRSHSFTDIVSAIYKRYPEMRANSVFQESTPT